jgi:hypothetical protein
MAVAGVVETNWITSHQWSRCRDVDCRVADLQVGRVPDLVGKVLPCGKSLHRNTITRDCSQQFFPDGFAKRAKGEILRE